MLYGTHSVIVRPLCISLFDLWGRRDFGKHDHFGTAPRSFYEFINIYTPTDSVVGTARFGSVRLTNILTPPRFSKTGTGYVPAFRTRLLHHPLLREKKHAAKMTRPTRRRRRSTPAGPRTNNVHRTAVISERTGVLGPVRGSRTNGMTAETM